MNKSSDDTDISQGIKMKLGAKSWGRHGAQYIQTRKRGCEVESGLLEKELRHSLEYAKHSGKQNGAVQFRWDRFRHWLRKARTATPNPKKAVKASCF